MSAPTPAPGDDRPREGYYPDPSIPGYVRYWNGAAWVPGTSRPAPSDGEPLAPPPGSRPAQVPAPSAPVEETGPHFFDEDPEPRPVSPAEAQHGSRPEPATAWGADRSRQSGFGGEQDRRVSWGAPQGADPRIPRASQPGDAAGRSDDTARTDGTATIPPADSDGSGTPASGGTVVFRRQGRGESATGAGNTGAAGSAGSGTGSAAGAGSAGSGHPAGAPGGAAAAAAHHHPSGTPAPAPSEGTMAFRALPPRTGEQGGSGSAVGSPPEQPFAARSSSAQAAARQALGLDPDAPVPGPQQVAAAPPQGGPAATGTPAAPQPTPSVPAQSTATPLTSGPGGGQPSWAQQVHRLAGEGDQPVVPWKPPVDDVFQAAARQQAAARPARLGKRLLARLLDTLVLGAVTGVAAVPLGTRAADHINDKIDAAKLSGEQVTVWLLDGTTAVYLGIVLAVLLLLGVLYEALPTAKWGRTLGKKLCGLEVRDIEGHEPPTFGLAVRRWLVYSVPGLLGIGVVGVLWCLFDRPWHQCWHDKAAHTFVAG